MSSVPSRTVPMRSTVTAFATSPAKFTTDFLICSMALNSPTVLKMVDCPPRSNLPIGTFAPEFLMFSATVNAGISYAFSFARSSSIRISRRVPPEIITSPTPSACSMSGLIFSFTRSYISAGEARPSPRA